MKKVNLTQWELIFVISSNGYEQPYSELVEFSGQQLSSVEWPYYRSLTSSSDYVLSFDAEEQSHSNHPPWLP